MYILKFLQLVCLDMPRLNYNEPFAFGFTRKYNKDHFSYDLLHAHVYPE